MKRLLSQLRLRLSQRQDSEHGQQIVRIVLISLILAYVLLPAPRHDLPHTQYVGVLAIVLTGLSLSLLLFGWLLWRPARSDPRRVLGMLADYGLIAAGMVQMGEPLSWVYIVVMWVTVGNGMRFGNHYLYVAVAMAMVSFGCTVLLTPYWQQNFRLAIGLWLGLAAVPLYFSTLLRQLTEAMAEARRASEAKSRFLANMSHEFRTPLNGLNGMTEVLATTRLDDEQRECLNTIQASSRSLLALVEEVLDISAIEAGKLRVVAEDFAVTDVIQAIGLILLPQAKAKRLDYRVKVADGVPPRVRGDVGHLRQILLNLAGNAVKFTDHGRVEIRVGVVQADTNGAVRLRFDILDTGIGVAPAMRARLFDAFEQADVSMARRHEGTGLGTTIAKGLVEAMDGDIGYLENPPRGSHFWVELPFAPPQPLVPGAVPSLTGDEDVGPGGNVIAFADPFLRHRARVRSMQILVADDHEANRMVLQRLLQKAGHRVLCVDGGEAVLDALADSEFDAVIVDLHMPGMSGLDMLKELRVMQAGGGPRTPVLVLSADVTPEAIQRCTQAGAHAFLAKPRGGGTPARYPGRDRQQRPVEDHGRAGGTAGGAAGWGARQQRAGRTGLAGHGRGLRARVHPPVPGGCGELHGQGRAGRRSCALGCVPRTVPRDQGRGQQPWPDARVQPRWRADADGRLAAQDRMASAPGHPAGRDQGRPACAGGTGRTPPARCC